MIGVCAGFAALLAAPLAASAEDAITAPAQKTIGQPTGKSEMIPSLAVINSRGATLQGNMLTLTGVGSNSIVFADRPFRAAGHVLTKHFLKEWDEGSDSFAKDPTS
jgi:predicted alpha/beta hydrolase family esterase